ncbi:carbohydrate-binding protein [Clostridium frigoris]|uniref:Carbohydrate-binding protein n=1 Tax=Clostridium frigoris TaxID=205327 RepID=A0ABS6BU21_9CLOT|nr:carbohydrate-binding protein [Clostridium frigoris]MBU3160403.1 carbohydrate-binding protein [Clostridium frigoris]
MENQENMLRIEIKDEANTTISEMSGMEEISLIHTKRYKEGDKICFTNLSVNKYLVINIDNELSEALIYVPGNILEFSIPFGDDSIPYSLCSFKDSTHIIDMRFATEEEIYCYRNLAKNVMDKRCDTTYYPHVTANVETGNDAIFAARNTIDGQTNNQGHGVWPYESWGTDQREDAELFLNFGREVEVDKIALYLRADFPRDTYWSHITIVFSDGTEEKVQPIKTSDAQFFEFDKKRISWVKLINFKMADEPAEFAALTEIEVYGTDIKEV